MEKIFKNNSVMVLSEIMIDSVEKLVTVIYYLFK